MNGVHKHTKGSKMKWLFWKEYRQNLLIVIAAAALLIVPYLFGLYAVCQWALTSSDEMLRYDYLIVAGIYSLTLSQLAIALIGGNAIAGERVDRSAEFQVYLPIARIRIFTAKVLLALAVAAVIWIVNLLIIGLLPKDNVPNDRLFLSRIIIDTAATGLMMFGVAWLCSASIKSPTIATFAGLIGPLVVWTIIYFVVALIEDRNKIIYWPPIVWTIMENTFRGLCCSLGPICFGIGTWLYLRRVEP
jgi:ABC-type transport system involved in multi-copper enzyme maturation permease subunit